MEINHLRKMNSKGHYQKLIKTANKRVNSKQCMRCGCSGVIESHTVPQNVLNNISPSHNYKTSYQFEISDCEPEKIGEKNAGTFHLLCQQCDTTLFRTYEKPESYSDPAKLVQIMKEIALKNALKKIYDYAHTVEFLSECKDEAECYKDKIEIDKVRKYYGKLLVHSDMELDLILDMYKKNESFKIIYKKTLDYKTPIAAQEQFPYLVNCEKTEYIPWMHLAVLPFASKTEIILFTRQKNIDWCYAKWLNEFNNKTDTEKLQIINTMIFEELDTYFIDKKFDSSKIKFSQVEKVTLENLRKRTVECPNLLIESI